MAEIPAGWPCAALPAVAPSVVDRQSDPTPDELLPQILPLAPRGPAWGTDEAGDGNGASPIQLRFWRAIAAWTASHLSRDFTVATQVFPSAADLALEDWEAELGLPDSCSSGEGGRAARVAAVRARFGAVGGASPAYFVCLARSLGYAITIEEPTQFLVDVSECVGGDPEETWFLIDESEVDTADLLESYFLIDDDECDGDPLEGFALAILGDGDPLEALVLAPDGGGEGDQVAGALIEDAFLCDDGACDDTPLETWHDDPNGTVWKFWIVHVGGAEETWFRVDEGECASDPLEGYLPAADLECLMRRLCPPHTALLFDYASAV